MFRVTGEIAYTDGRTVSYEATQREFAAWERYAIRNGLPPGTSTQAAAGGPLAIATMQRYLAYSAVMRGDEEPTSFEVWDAMVLDVTAVQGAELADPTLPDRSDDPSR